MVLRVEKGTFVASADVLAVEVRNDRLTPAEAEVRVTVALRGVLAEPELRGRLVGPRCAYASTVEVAYPWRPLSPERPNVLAARVIIPEPSLWDPVCPFLYEGPLELSHKGGRGYTWQVSHGLRSVHLGPGGLRWNGQLLPLRGLASRRGAEADADAPALRRAGYNSLLVGLPPPADPQAASIAALCTWADRFGLVVLARVPNSPDALAWFRGLGDHACFLGWLLPRELVEHEAARAAAVAELGSGPGCLLGAELTRPLPAEHLAGIAFVCCREDLLPALGHIPQPKLVLTDRDPPPEAAPGILGWARA
jgi:hypothetical protein